MIYEENASGQAYRTDLELPAEYPPRSSSLLPVVDPTGSFERDQTTLRTGNSILCCVESEPFWATLYDASTQRCDTFKMVYYYLSEVDRPTGDRGTKLLLMRWESVDYAHYGQVWGITDPLRRKDFARLLYAGGIRRLWDPHQPPNLAFYAIDVEGNIGLSPDQAPSLKEFETRSAVLGIQHGPATVAWNRGASFWTAEEVPKFVSAGVGPAGFPHGFEVQVVGPSGARQVFVRLVLASQFSTKRLWVSEEFTGVVNAREF